MEPFDLGLLLSVGQDVYISARAEIRRPHLSKLGSHIAIDSGFYCTTKLELGDYIHISPQVSCIGGEQGSFTAKGFNNIMAGARIICVSDRFDDSGLFGALIPEKYLGKQIKKPVVMEPFSNLATNAVLLPGSILREGALLSIGSVLMGDTEPWTVYKGNPAVAVKKIDGSKAISHAKELGYEFR
jgi:acetyltransferase-like isoleucine patch superfamily enzyme